MRELNPREVIADLLEEPLIPDPKALAEAIIRHLADAGFEIVPAERHQP